MKYFVRQKYQVPIVSRELHKRWLSENPAYKKTEFKNYSKFKEYWRIFIKEMLNRIVHNPAGVDLQDLMGNLSIKILDIDFKCSKDFLVTKRPNKETKKPELTLVPTSASPKKAHLTWAKQYGCPSMSKYMGFEASSLTKKRVGRAVRGRENYYEKAFDHDVVPSKCEEVPEPSLFDLA